MSVANSVTSFRQMTVDKLTPGSVLGSLRGRNGVEEEEDGGDDDNDDDDDDVVDVVDECSRLIYLSYAIKSRSISRKGHSQAPFLGHNSNKERKLLLTI